MVPVVWYGGRDLAKAPDPVATETLPNSIYTINLQEIASASSDRCEDYFRALDQSSMGRAIKSEVERQ